jgi:hypothetical protein
MKSEIADCSGCGTKTEHLKFGLVPESAFSHGHSELWFEASLCSECGALNRKTATEAQESIAIQRLMDALREVGLYEELYGDDSDSGALSTAAGD